MQLGVFISIGNNGWLISITSPQYLPSFDFNNEVVHGLGGPSQFWDYNLEFFTLHGGGVG